MNKQKGLAPVFIVILIALAVGGYLLYQKQTKPVASQPVAQPSPSSVTSPTSTNSAETANWKTYTNEKYGYSFKYPSEWVSCNYDNVVLLYREESSCPKGDFVPTSSISVRDNTNLPLIRIGEHLKLVSKAVTNVGGQQGEKAVIEVIIQGPGPDKFIEAAVAHNGKTYNFTLNNLSKEEIFNQILSTFKFTQ